MDPAILTQDFEPIQSYNKLANIERFNQLEAKRAIEHMNDPLSTKILHYSVVVVVVLIAMLIFFKLCWDTEKFSRRNPHFVPERRLSIGTKSLMSPSSDKFTSILIPEANYHHVPHHHHNSHNHNHHHPPTETHGCAPIVSNNGRNQKFKGWKRQRDEIEQPYLPTARI